MSYFIFDTETTSFPSDKLPPKNLLQAHICQIAMLQLDEQFIELDSFVALIHPEGRWKVSDGAYNVHGISTAECEQHGVPITHAIDRWIRCHDACHTIVGHNLKFDKLMIEIELGCLDSAPIANGTKKEVCTMESLTPIMKLPHTRRNAFGTAYKWPKLHEAYSFVTSGKQLDGAHDALVDVRATAKLLEYLVANGHIKN